MANLGDKQTIVPDFRVFINGTPIPTEISTDLMTVIVHEDIEAPSMFSLKLTNWDIQKHQVTWSDDKRWFKMGNEVEIQMGYINHLKKLFNGEITSLEPEFEVNEAPSVIVRGYDRRHRLLRGRYSQTFLQMKDSEIASKIANAVKLIPKPEDTQVKLDYVLQHNQTHWEFLQERAQRIGYEVVVEDKTLYFRPHKNADSPVLTLDLNTDLMEFYPRLTTLPEVGQIKVRGWNPKEKSEIVGLAKAGNEGTTMGGSTTGPTDANQSFGSAINSSVKRPIFSKAEADQIALGYLKDMALEYITGEGLAIGRTDLRAGKVLKIQGIGQRFSGNYYITSTTHTCSPKKGYRTRFTVRRNAT
ncbi:MULTISPECIES: phage late control D family protein [unclassified Nostoc]|uniref:phage late control D family protein n=1 Tax=unclassified Nostoc TaxID=2593658 RepID=UPI002AD3BE8E|nr:MULTISPECIES: contractile injection system protein, VgrG/Pvc8 family [unclassified Nostoc]MDZ8124257.1 contractile injection system protein, VgrG/Pvc8 family [Nostoc sp. CmiVER01]MDZ8228186.1 contractile injection system protein, VgrG/Pvc8 family [Nostoc sp. ChiVER01]